jgi:hypothetical protein
VAPLLRLAIRLRHGSRVGWHGVDVFHFNAAGEITGKYTYASYDRPRLSRTLGVPLWRPPRGTRRLDGDRDRYRR